MSHNFLPPAEPGREPAAPSAGTDRLLQSVRLGAGLSKAFLDAVESGLEPWRALDMMHEYLRAMGRVMNWADAPVPADASSGASSGTPQAK